MALRGASSSGGGTGTASPTPASTDAPRAPRGRPSTAPTAARSQWPGSRSGSRRGGASEQLVVLGGVRQQEGRQNDDQNEGGSDGVNHARPHAQEEVDDPVGAWEPSAWESGWGAGMERVYSSGDWCQVHTAGGRAEWDSYGRDYFPRRLVPRRKSRENWRTVCGPGSSRQASHQGLDLDGH